MISLETYLNTLRKALDHLDLEIVTILTHTFPHISLMKENDDYKLLSEEVYNELIEKISESDERECSKGIEYIIINFEKDEIKGTLGTGRRDRFICPLTIYGILREDRGFEWIFNREDVIREINLIEQLEINCTSKDIIKKWYKIVSKRYFAQVILY
jgi:hypothetical protein